MKRLSTLILIIGLMAALPAAFAGDITGTVTLKGTPPKEKEITPMKEDANCSKLHTSADDALLRGRGQRGAGRCRRFPAGDERQIHRRLGAAGGPRPEGLRIYAVHFRRANRPEDYRQELDPVLHNVHDVPGADQATRRRTKPKCPAAPT